MDSDFDQASWFQQEMLERQRRGEEADKQQERIDDLKRDTLTEFYKWIDSTRDEPCKA